MQTSVISLRRYPVKSMGGESLDTARVDARGIAGDRWYAVQDDDGHFASGKNTRRFRRRDAVFDYAAHTEPGGDVVITQDRRRWYADDPSLAERLSTEMGTPVRITPEAGVPHQDMGSVSIVGTATLQWCAQRWGGSPDPCRLRANIVVDSHEPFVEEQWVGRHIEVGTARLRVIERTPRCRMIDIRQDGVEPGVRWLKPLARERDMCLAVYADVSRPGTISRGDRPQAG